MSLTFQTLYQKVLLRLNQSDGRAMLAAKEGVNSAHKYIAMVHDFDELITLDSSNANTVANLKTYVIGNSTNEWNLTRLKDILSIRYMDGDNSRKLDYVPSRTWDQTVPYPEGRGYDRPRYYTRRGNIFELYPIPANANSLYIQHSQWPTSLANDADTSSYDDVLEDVIVALGTEIAQAILSGGGIGNWTQRAKELLGLAGGEEEDKPDRTWVAQPFTSGDSAPLGEWWKMPFVKRDP